MGILPSNMILYHAANLCCYVKCIVHKMLYAEDEAACFIGYSWLLDKYGSSSLFLKEHGFSPMLGAGGSQNHLSQMETEEYIESYFDEIFKAWKISPTDFTELHIGSYYTGFAAYLNIKGIKHFVHEECAGDFNNTKEWAEDKQKYKAALAIRSKYGMYQCENENILTKFAVTSRLNKDIDQFNIINFEVYNEIFKLSDLQQSFLADYFKLPKQFERKNNSVLLLTEWFNMLGEKRSDREILHMYAALIDYYCDGKNVCIKPHPADPMRDLYASSFEKAEVMQSGYPSELMGLIKNIGFDAAFTINSTSIYTVGKFCEKTLSTGKSFTAFYMLLNKFFVAFMLADFLKPTWDSCYRYGLFDDEYNMLSEANPAFPPCKWKNLDKLSEGDLYIIDKVKWSIASPKFDISLLSNAGYNNIFIFTNSDNADCFFSAQHEELLSYIVPIKLKKLAVTTAKEPLCEMYEEVIFLFCRNFSIREKVKQFSIEKRFSAMGIILTASPCKLAESEHEFLKLRVKAIERENQRLQTRIDSLEQTLNDITDLLKEF